MTPSRSHAESVVANFNEEAPRWQRNYASADGSMTPRLALFEDALRKNAPPPAAVLDFGCGTGELSCALSARGWQMSGCDASSAMLAVARAGAPQGNWVHIDPAPHIPLPFHPASFQAVVASSVFEYLSDPEVTLKHLARILSPGGCLLLTVPDPRSSVRRRERVLSIAARTPPCWKLLQMTRYRLYFNYLRLSVNRFPLERWNTLLISAGLKPQPIPAVTGALALLIARKAC